MLQIKNLNLNIGDLVLAKNMNLSLAPGKVHVIIGPNGTGKSTLLKALFGEIKPQSGEIIYGDRVFGTADLSTWRHLFAYMPQDTRLSISLSVLELVLLGNVGALSLHLDEETISRGLKALDQLGLLSLAKRKVNTLSGGQCQMVLFAQALMRQTHIFMLDEPVSALDLYYQQVLLEHLVEQTYQNQWVTLMVLHDLNLAVQYSDNLIVLHNGIVKACGIAQEVMSKELIQEVYNVRADVSYDLNGQPFIRTCRAEKTQVPKKVMALKNTSTHVVA